MLYHKYMQKTVPWFEALLGWAMVPTWERQSVLQELLHTAISMLHSELSQLMGAPNSP